jgi:hypothetical protein
MKKSLETTALVLVLVLFCIFAAHAITIDTVTVGNPNNAADTAGYGLVADMYAISKYEITAGQYCEFLKAVARSDNYGLYNLEHVEQRLRLQDPANRHFRKLQLQCGSRLGQPSGEFCFLGRCSAVL